EGNGAQGALDRIDAGAPSREEHDVSTFDRAKPGPLEQFARRPALQEHDTVVEVATIHRESSKRIHRIVLEDEHQAAGTHDPAQFGNEVVAPVVIDVMKNAGAERKVEARGFEWQRV